MRPPEDRNVDMGLDAVVYRSAQAVVRAYGADSVLTDPMTGEAYARPGSSLKIPRDVTVATSRRLGNVGEIAFIRTALGEMIGHNGGPESIVARIVSSGSHSGDVIGVDELPRLGRELRRLQATDVLELKSFVEALLLLLAAALRENNPIVCV